MYLKTLALTGFKSFADRTRLEFGSGVNVVVGPNGSGKSNLVDAVSWVLGTQAAGALRTQKMEEVIFSGTSLRPPHGRAEVNLVFDNGEGRLPLDLPEVTITRRLFRNGTSEYEVNGAPCRLLDIQDLLSDSGVGRHQHIIVGQGRIGTILNARPEDHRSVIEEAAGVVKHRNRRDRSIRRLEQTDTDLTRLRDILAEQHRRMRPLRRQAKAAEQYDDLRNRVRALRLWLGGAELRTLRERLAAAGEEHSRFEAREAGAREELVQLAVAFPELEQIAGSVGRALERDTAAAARLETAVERIARVGMVARERRLATESRMRGAGDRRLDLVEELERLRLELARASEEERLARGRTERTEVVLRALEDEERSLAEQSQLPAEGVAASIRGDLAALEAAVDRDRSEDRALSSRLEVISAQLRDEEREAEVLRADIRRIDIEVAPAQQAFKTVQEISRTDQAQLERAETALQEGRLDLERARARLEALEATIDGVGDPAGWEIAESHAAVLGTLVSVLDVPAGLEAAVDAALGGWASSLVASEIAVGDVVGAVKSAGYGGVAVVTAGSSQSNAPAQRVAREWGLEALVDRLGPDADPAIRSRMLGDVVVVEGWAVGWDLVRRHPEIRAVTPEGDLITSTGMRMGIPDGAGPAALEAARATAEDADTEHRRAESLHASSLRSFTTSRQRERETLELLEALEARIAGGTEALGVIERVKSEHLSEKERLTERRDSLLESSTARDERIGHLKSRLIDLEGEESAAQQAWEDVNRRREAVATRRETSRRALEEAAADLAAVREATRINTARAERIEADLAVLSDQPTDPALPERMAQVEERARRAIDIVRHHIETLRERQRELRASAGSAGERLEEAHGRQRQLEGTVAGLKDQMAALDIEIAELRVRDEATAEALRREADASEEEALAAVAPDLDEGADPGEVLESLAGRLRRLGPINPLAAAEYKDLEERASFLQSQIDDLEESRRELRKVIEALDAQIGVQFHAAFEEIARFYEENFRLLFPGGSGTLRLTEPSDPLNTGVEIEAQPLGKKVMRLALLSGGERSLAALAFLFAVFRARPSPFYILDEVEAALDDANLRRFLRLVDTIRGSSQLVIITHQQHTMEAADILYGVTMEPGESSKVVAKRLAAANV